MSSPRPSGSDPTKLPLTGGTLTGALTIDPGNGASSVLDGYNLAFYQDESDSTMGLSQTQLSFGYAGFLSTVLSSGGLSVSNNTFGSSGTTGVSPGSVSLGQNEYNSSLSGYSLNFSNSDSGRYFSVSQNNLQQLEEVNVSWPIVNGSLVTDQSVWPDFNPIGWTDTQLRRDGQANTLAIRGTTNAGTVTNRFHTYGFYNNASNYVRASLHCTGTLVTLAAERAGTGAANVDINITPAGTGRVQIMGQSAVAGLVACTHTALIKVNGTQYKVLLSNL